ncbi:MULTISPECIES: flagellar hook-associated protein 2 [unclassified Psychrobacillus]|uniref:flagellar hook-associated protein 2 n=1 Tax=unclassified Psychrobacillus TaxID=2636677 RepID=UPI0012471A19|nr:flagellar hook-associated protein 2 [Psychrobacillus sp. AK 1817]QEY20486.1 flagellar hook-associated protein 2 [Psychrobacillus sp. AK 1817]
MAGLRVGGLASGMDIDQIVGDLMKAERIPLDKLFQKKTTTEWQRDSYRSINTKLNTFHTKLYDDFLAPNSFNKKIVSVSHENIVTATATSAASGSLSIQKVEQLASASYGVGRINANTASTITMKELGVSGDQNVKLGVLQADGTMKDFEFTFKETDTISDVVKQINNKGAGITALYDEKSGQLSLSTKASGKSAEGVEIIDRDKSGFFGKLGFSDAEKIASNGKNAKVTINGAEVERNSNNFTVAGFNITLKDTTAAGASTITLNSTTDINSMVDKVKEFVEKYNELITGMNDSLKEKKYRDYPPLTDEQRKDMSDKEQELWDEKAKSGLLRNDSIVNSGLSSMRNAIYGRVDGMGDDIIDTLAEMGITTSSVYSDGGKLVINEDKLKKALTENPDKVVQTLTQSGEKTNSGDTRGIIQRLRETMKEFTTNIETKAGKTTHTDSQYSLGKSLIDMNTRISNFQRRLEDIETRYWKQFTAMEQAISKANSQSGYLSQFGQS